MNQLEMHGFSRFPTILLSHFHGSASVCNHPLYAYYTVLGSDDQNLIYLEGNVRQVPLSSTHVFHKLIQISVKHMTFEGHFAVPFAAGFH